MSDSDAPADRPHTTAFSSADPPRNFSLTVGERIRALTIGAPAYATRKKHIEDLEAVALRALVTLHDTLVARGRDEQAICQGASRKANGMDVKKLNALIEAHNRYYPIEANLPTNPRTGEYLIYGRPWRPETVWTATRLVAETLAIVTARRARSDR